MLDHGGIVYRTHMELFHRLRLNKILVAGNGICTLPYFLEHHGFDVLAIDACALAMEFVTSHPPDDDHWWWFYRTPLRRGLSYIDDQDRSRIIATAKQNKIPGGALRFMQADLFNVNIAAASVDVVIAENLLDYYQAADRQVLARRFHEWLKPNGIAIIGSRYQSLDDAGKVVIDIADDVKAAGFQIQKWKVDKDFRQILENPRTRPTSPTGGTDSNGCRKEDESESSGASQQCPCQKVAICQCTC